MTNTLARIARLAAVLALVALVVVPSALAIRFTDDSFQVPKAAVGSYYTHEFRGEGGCGPALPYQFRILSGGLPPGLTLAPDGFVSGVPTRGGNFSFWLELSDQDPPSATWCVPKRSERLFTIDVGPRGSVPGVQVGPRVPGNQRNTGSGGTVSGGGESDPAFWDIPGQIKKAIDDWFRHLVTDALNPALELVGKTLLSTPQVVSSGRVGQLWTYSLGIADALLVLLIVIAGALVMGHETVQSRYALKDSLQRLGVTAVAVNASLSLSGQLIGFANALACVGSTPPARKPNENAFAIPISCPESASEALATIAANASRGSASFNA